MATKQPASAQEIYQIKVTLAGTRPPIWRRLLLPAETTLELLHHVLQAAVGWQECHMHDFRIGRQRFGKPEPEYGFEDTVNERTVRFSAVLGKVGAKAVYTYDFGDSWEHDIVVEKVLKPDPALAYPVCIAGKLQGPPEDCGGIDGYYNLIEALGDPNHAEHEDLLEWIGGEFNPNDFSVEDVNRRLAPFRRRKAKRKAGS